MSTTIKPTEAGTAFLTTPVSESAERIFTLEQRDEEQRWIAESAATFVQREVLPHVEAIDHQEPGLMPSLLKKAGEQGLLGIDVPEEYGGTGLGCVEAAVLMEEMGRALIPGPFFSTFAAGMMLDACGSAEQKSRYLAPVCGGEARAERSRKASASRATHSTASAASPSAAQSPIATEHAPPARGRLAVVGGELRLVVERVEVAGAALLAEEDHALRPRGEV